MSEQVKILIADDDAYNLSLLRLLLKPRGFVILEAMNGAEALELATAQLPDLLVLDVMMPEMSGLEVCAAVKKNPATEAIPVILLTAQMTTLGDKLEGLRLGANDFITKPVDPAELEARIVVQLRIKRLQNRLVNLERVSNIVGTTNTLSHKINKPLMEIISLAKSLREMFQRGQQLNLAEANRNLEVIIGQAQRISDVVRELQQIARAVEAEKHPESA